MTIAQPTEYFSWLITYSIELQFTPNGFEGSFTLKNETDEYWTVIHHCAIESVTPPVSVDIERKVMKNHSTTGQAQEWANGMME